MTMTFYKVLVPTTTKGLYQEVATYVLETEDNETRLPEYVQKLLVNSGRCPDNIRVVRA